MKILKLSKLALVSLLTVLFANCSSDDNAELNYSLAEVVETEFPEFFEKGKSYQIKVTYELPTACHSGAGVQVRRGATEGEKRRDIYVAGVAISDSDLATCEKESDDLEREKSFPLIIDEDETYTFYLWTGVDEDDENTYTEIEVPVGEPEEE